MIEFSYPTPRQLKSLQRPQQERRSMHTATPVIEYRAEIPDPLAFVRLFTTTGWDPQGHLTVAAAAEALAPTWYAVSAYAGVRLVGTGRIISDGVLHALLADCIVDPAYRHRGIGGVIVERLVAECRRHRIVDVQLFCARGVQPFYERLGFTARPDDAPGMELVRRTRNLTSTVATSRPRTPMTDAPG